MELEPSWAAVERVSGEQACISAVGDETRRTTTADIPPPLSHPFLSMLLVLSDAGKISPSQPPLVLWRSYFSLPFPLFFSIHRTSALVPCISSPDLDPYAALTRLDCFDSREKGK